MLARWVSNHQALVARDQCVVRVQFMLPIWIDAAGRAALELTACYCTAACESSPCPCSPPHLLTSLRVSVRRAAEHDGFFSALNAGSSAAAVEPAVRHSHRLAAARLLNMGRIQPADGWLLVMLRDVIGRAWISCVILCVILWVSCVILCTMGMRCIGPNRQTM